MSFVTAGRHEDAFPEPAGGHEPVPEIIVSLLDRCVKGPHVDMLVLRCRCDVQAGRSPGGVRIKVSYGSARAVCIGSAPDPSETPVEPAIGLRWGAQRRGAQNATRPLVNGHAH